MYSVVSSPIKGILQRSHLHNYPGRRGSNRKRSDQRSSRQTGLHWRAPPGSPQLGWRWEHILQIDQVKGQLTSAFSNSDCTTFCSGLGTNVPTEILAISQDCISASFNRKTDPKAQWCVCVFCSEHQRQIVCMSQRAAQQSGRCFLSLCGIWEPGCSIMPPSNI